VFRAFARKYGDIVSLRIGSREMWLVSRPDLIAQIFRDHHPHFEKDWGPRRGHYVLDGGIVTAEGADHRAQRTQFSRLFSRAAIAAQRDAIADAIEDWSNRRRDGETIDLHREMSFLGIDIAARVLFGSRIDLPSAHDMAEVVMALFRRWMVPFGRHVPRRNPRLQVAPIFEQLHRNRYREGLLSSLFDLPDSGPHIRTFLMAGQETIRLATSWSWFLISKHPEAGERMRAEGEPYAECVLEEAMRLYPPQWMVGKRAVDDYPLDGYVVPRGTTVLMSPYIVQRDERWFADAERFVPERWQHAEPNPAYFPFGGGARRCIGETFALVEGTMILSMLAKKWRFACEGNADLDAGLTLTPRSMMARVAAV
jgi:cytochrome P450